MDLFTSLAAIMMGLSMYFLMVSRHRWLSIIGYLLGVLFIIIVSMYIGMSLKVCAPVRTFYM